MKKKKIFLRDPDIFVEFSKLPPKSIAQEKIIELIGSKIKKGKIVDYMCGDGTLLMNIVKEKKDVSAIGIDLENKFIKNRSQSNPTFLCMDALTVSLPEESFDGIINFASFHHLKPDKRNKFVEKIQNELKDGGYFFAFDYFISDYNNDTERKHAVIDLLTEEMKIVVDHGASDEVIKLMLELIEIHLFKKGEWLLTMKEFEELFSEFSIEKKERVFGKEDHGGFIYVFQKKS